MANWTPEQIAEREKQCAESEARGLELARNTRRFQLAQQLGSRYGSQLHALENFVVYDAAQKKTLEKLRQLAARLPEALQAGEGVVFFGPVGTGKDHLLAWLLYAAVDRGASVKWVNGQEVFGEFRDMIDTKQRDRDLFQALAAPDVLGISDPIPPVGKPGQWDLGNLYRILDRRYRNMKPTWVTLNALSLDDADGKLSAPVFDRLRHDATLFPCFWPSFRERAKTGAVA